MAASSSVPSSLVTTNINNTVANIGHNKNCVDNATKNGLVIQKISWEDTARYKNSYIGPNISDMTLKSGGQCFPMIRYPNFRDKTCDVNISKLNVTVGNESLGSELTCIPLKDYLQNIGNYVSGRDIGSMYCDRDSHILTSVQYCILPLQDGTVEFNVNLYNYQSSDVCPGVLVIVSSQKGTSTQAIFRGETDLYFNINGNAANFVAERLQDERKRLGKDLNAKMDRDESERNALFIYQVPLVISRKMVLSFDDLPEEEECFDEEECDYEEEELCDYDGEAEKCGSRGMDNAVLSVGKSHSEFPSVGNFDIKRDPTYPIRLTIQKYKVTDTSTIDPEVFVDIKKDIDRIYSGNMMGSLVTENNGNRTTEWDPSGNLSNKHNSVEFQKTISMDTVNNNPLFY